MTDATSSLISIPLETLRARGTRKWTVYEDDILPLWIAESDFPTAEPVAAAIAQAVANESFGYTPDPRRSGLSEAVADFYHSRFGWAPQPEHIFPIGDVVRGLLIGVQYFSRPDSPVIVPVPSYPPLLELPEAAGREKIEVPITTDGLDLAAIERAFAAGAGSLLLSNPYNPLGIVFNEAELRELVSLARRYDARIFADEIHAPLVLDGEHIPLAALGPDIAFTVTATSKAWNTAGLKCAQVLLNEEDARRWRSLNGVIKDGTGTLGVIAATAAYRDGIDFLEQQLDLLRRNRDWLTTALPQAVPGLTLTNPAATYLMWLDFSATAISSHQPAAWLRRHAKVALNEGTDFGSGGEGHARLNFATSPEILHEAVARIGAAVAGASGAAGASDAASTAGAAAPGGKQ